MRTIRKMYGVAILIVALWSNLAAANPPIVVGAKKFTESYILAEIISQWLEFNKIDVVRKFPLAGTVVAYQALKVGDIQIYPDYTGTISLNILKAGKDLSLREINQGLESEGIEMLPSFGFNNTYALAVAADRAKFQATENISDLAGKSFVLGLDHEFHKRKDGWEPLADVYSLRPEVKAMEHSLVYQGIKNKVLDGMIAYSTDAKLMTLQLKVLKDDKQFFPKYLAGSLIRKDLQPDIKRLLMSLTGRIDEKTMMGLNAAVEIEQKAISDVAANFLKLQGLVGGARVNGKSNEWAGLWKHFLEHLVLTFLPICMGVIVALPLAVFLINHAALAKYVLAAVGLLQTIPSLAMLVFMIWAFEAVGFIPAIVALFLYGLLPILRNSYIALKNIDPVLIKAARGIGMSRREILLEIRFPLGRPVFISGVRIAAVINVGMATIAAFIGAGGLGQPIVTGLSLNDTNLILTGAVPSALLAVAIEFGFNLLEKDKA